MNQKHVRNRLKTLLSAALLIGIAHSTSFGDANIYTRTLKSTAWVLSKTSDGTSSGAGVLVDGEKKLIMTNAHVVGDSRNAVIFFPKMKDDRPIVERDHYLDNVKKLGLRGRVITVDRKRDLALIQLEKLPKDATPIEMADQSVLPGEEVQSIGNAGSTEALWVFTSGKVRAVYQKKFRTGAGPHDFKVVETDTPINSGDSGGPVVNSEGKLVAISQAIAKKARLVSYSVDISEVKAFMDSPWKEAPLPVKKVLEDTNLEFTKHDSTGHFKVDIKTSNSKDGKDNATAVFITKDVEYYQRAEVRKIWSLAHVAKKPLAQETLLRLLEQSAQTKMGAWTLEKNSDNETLVIFVVKVDATATHDAVKSTMEYVAKLSSAMKKELAPKKEKEDPRAILSNWLMN